MATFGAVNTAAHNPNKDIEVGPAHRDAGHPLMLTQVYFEMRFSSFLPSAVIKRNHVASTMSIA